MFELLRWNPLSLRRKEKFNTKITASDLNTFTITFLINMRLKFVMATSLVMS